MRSISRDKSNRQREASIITTSSPILAKTGHRGEGGNSLPVRFITQESDRWGGMLKMRGSRVSARGEIGSVLVA